MGLRVWGFWVLGFRVQGGLVQKAVFRGFELVALEDREVFDILQQQLLSIP